VRRQAFLNFLVRSVCDGSLTEDDAANLLRRFDSGEPLTAPADYSIDYDKAIIVALLLFVLFRQRPNAINLLQNEFHATARRLALLPLLEWQSAMAQLITVNVIAARMLADGSTVTDIAALKPAVTRQIAFLGRFADKRALLEHQGRAMSPAAIAARSELYAGAGRTAYFGGLVAESDAGSIVDFISRDDGGTCAACLDADHGGPYLPQAAPLPGDVCLSGGRCRCWLDIRYAPSEALKLAA
jgi:hypothetical protein